MCDAHPRVLVGLGGVQVAPGALEHRVDLDRVDVVRALGQGQRDVVAVAGAHDQHVAGVAGRCVYGSE